MSRSSSSFAFHPRSKFDAYLEGQLTRSANQRMQAHLESCQRCATEVEQRSSALNITLELDRLWQSQPARTNHESRTTKPAEAGVMSASGVAGWKVLIAAGFVSIVLGGIALSIWLLGGDQRTYGSAESDAPVLIPEDVEIVHTDPQKLLKPTPSSDSTEAPIDFRAASPDLAFASAPLGMTGNPVLLSSITDLRNAGWTIPQFHALGMAFESAVIDESGGQYYVVSLFNGSSFDTEHQTVVRECRAEHDDGTVSACKQLDFAQSIATKMTLPVAQDVWVYRYQDDSWTAYMDTAKSQYRVDSTTQADLAPSIMSALYVEEKSRLSTISNSGEQGIGQRFERGLERLIGN